MKTISNIYLEEISIIREQTFFAILSISFWEYKKTWKRWKKRFIFLRLIICTKGMARHQVSSLYLSNISFHTLSNLFRVKSDTEKIIAAINFFLSWISNTVEYTAIKYYNTNLICCRFKSQKYINYYVSL